MKIFSKVLILLQFGVVITLMGSAFILNYVIESYPAVKHSIISFIKKVYKEYSLNTQTSVRVA